MMDSSDHSGPRRPGTRPFVGGRPVARVEPTMASYTPARPFSLATARTRTAAGITTTALTIDAPGGTPTPLWTVAVYEPGLEQRVPPDRGYTPAALQRYPLQPANPTEQVVDASLALAEDVVEAGRHATSAAAADVLDVVARKLRRGEILLLPGASTQSESAVVSAVLAALLGGRR